MKKRLFALIAITSFSCGFIQGMDKKKSKKIQDDLRLENREGQQELLTPSKLGKFPTKKVAKVVPVIDPQRRKSARTLDVLYTLHRGSHDDFFVGDESIDYGDFGGGSGLSPKNSPVKTPTSSSSSVPVLSVARPRRNSCPPELFAFGLYHPETTTRLVPKGLAE